MSDEVFDPEKPRYSYHPLIPGAVVQRTGDLIKVTWKMAPQKTFSMFSLSSIMAHKAFSYNPKDRWRVAEQLFYVHDTFIGEMIFKLKEPSGEIPSPGDNEEKTSEEVSVSSDSTAGDELQ